MSINVMLYDHPIVSKAIDEAAAIVNSWADGVTEGDRHAAKLATSGWDGVALIERIAIALLEREGIDDNALDLFELLADEHPDKSLMDPHGALFELWDAERKEQP